MRKTKIDHLDMEIKNVRGEDMKDKDIMDKYWFFQSDPTLRTNLMAFGFECAEGWFPMIDELCSKIANLIDEKYPELKNDFIVTQVKEKFGMLRFYTNYGNDEIYGLVEEYEGKSATICEICGSKEAECKSNGCGYWISTLCDKCREESNL